MNNYGIDQNYVQRYMTTSSTKEAVKSTMFGSLLYVPVSLIFVYIGTALFSYYNAQPELLPAGTPADQVFPHFIVHGLPTGITGLVIAAIFSAGMSTVATSINSSATIVLTDFVKHFSKKERTDKKDMKTLYATSLVVGIVGIIIGILMMQVDGVLDAWWTLASIFSGGVLGLFLLTLISRKPHRAASITAAVAGMLVVIWIAIMQVVSPEPAINGKLAIVFGTTVIMLVGFLLTMLLGKKSKKAVAK